MKKVLMASTQDGSQSPVTHSCPKYTVATRALAWFSICGSLAVQMWLKSLTTVRTTNSTCRKTGSSIAWLWHTIIETERGVINKLALTNLCERRRRSIFNNLPLVDILGSSIYRPDDSEEPIKYVSQVTSWPCNAIVWYLKRPCHFKYPHHFQLHYMY